ncbi:hypothetical protein PENARI_c015G05721 [Penicillium arizonense]|uniref:Uncharacterized protein n=1 Tax=Penicillium arizonense TaxID=1835702 RepID=A0A1F5LC76_PENAI|nr:hypothetical protein PENARI_c015G05721 [Penicillium arizonense]OGE50802.1 hypothetical protein PENARI_c015G05721 [Penicillium arizonense]
MPADVNDVDLLTGLKAARTAPSTSTSRPTKMAYLLLDVQLHRIASKINEHVSSYQHTVRFDTGKLEAKVTSVREMCDARYQSDTEEPLAIHHQANLHILYNLFESPDFKPYNWYTIGLGSFHAFHAGGTLAAVVFNPECYSEYEEIKNLLDLSLRMFASLSIHSALCAKAVPILQQIVKPPQ